MLFLAPKNTKIVIYWWRLRALALKNAMLLLYHLKKPLYYLYHSILQYLPHPKTLFLLKYYYLIFFYYFFLTNFFFQFYFPRLSNRFFFFPLPPSTPARLTEPHRPITDQPTTDQPTTQPLPKPRTQPPPTTPLSTGHSQKKKPASQQNHHAQTRTNTTIKP